MHSQKYTITLFASLAIGCNTVNEKEAGLVYETTLEIFQQIHDDAVLVEDETVELGLSSGPSWEGAVTISGSRTVNLEDIIYPLSVSFIDVYAIDTDITLNGQVSFGMAVTPDQTDNLSYESLINIDGEFDVEGDAKGIAEILLTMTRAYDGGEDRYTTTLNGSIGGHSTDSL